MDEFDTPPGGTVAMDEETPPVETDGPTPAVKTCIEGAQMLLDLTDQLNASIGQSEHKKARKYIAKIIAELEATADEMAAMGEKVRSELEDEEAEGDEPPVEDSAELDDDIEEKAILPIERDKDGYIVCKAFPNWKPQRARFADLKDIVDEAVSPAEAKAIERRLARAHRRARPYLTALEN